MHPYKSVDPFAASIHQSLQSNHRDADIRSIDDIGPPRWSPRLSPLARPSSVHGQLLAAGHRVQTPHRLISYPSDDVGLDSTQALIPRVPSLSQVAQPPSVQVSSSQPHSSHQVGSQASVAHLPPQQTSPSGNQAPQRGRPFPARRSTTFEPRPEIIGTTTPVRTPTGLLAPQAWDHNYQLERVTSGSTSSDPTWQNHLGGDDQGTDSPTSEDHPSPPSARETTASGQYIKAFLFDTLPRQIYLHCLLRLPSLYFSRVDRIFKDADLTLEEIKDMALRASAEDKNTLQRLNFGFTPFTVAGDPPSLAYKKLKTNWELFIDALMREWKTLNIISALLLSGILTIFQIDAAAADPVTRYLAFWSLVCAMLSLLCGGLLIIRFSSMRKPYKAVEWAMEAVKYQTMLWNVWIMLAMPAIWLSWSIMTYTICIMSFMWRVPAKQAPVNSIPPGTNPLTELVFRTFVCFVLGIGVLYGMLIINTLRCYGTQMDDAWTRRINSFIQQSTFPRHTRPEPLPPLTPRGVLRHPTPQGLHPPPISLTSRSSIPQEDNVQSPFIPPPPSSRSSRLSEQESIIEAAEMEIQEGRVATPLLVDGPAFPESIEAPLWQRALLNISEWIDADTLSPDLSAGGLGLGRDEREDRGTLRNGHGVDSSKEPEMETSQSLIYNQSAIPDPIQHEVTAGDRDPSVQADSSFWEGGFELPLGLWEVNLDSEDRNGNPDKEGIAPQSRNVDKPSEGNNETTVVYDNQLPNRPFIPIDNVSPDIVEPGDQH